MARLVFVYKLRIAIMVGHRPQVSVQMTQTMYNAAPSPHVAAEVTAAGHRPVPAPLCQVNVQARPPSNAVSQAEEEAAEAALPPTMI